MTEISAAMVKELREKTGAGMMDCKVALSKSGSMEEAIKFLREKGLAQAAKKTGRIAAEGLIAVEMEDNCASIIELNSETDFVARNQDFQNLASRLAKTALAFKTPNNHQWNFEGQLLGNQTIFAGTNTVDAEIVDKIATIGEKIALRRFSTMKGGSLYGQYLHGAGSIGVIIECQLNNPEFSKNNDVIQTVRDISMHIAASNPSFIDETTIDKAWLESERAIFKAQLLGQGKPENMVEKILEGKMKKHVQDNCLLYQPFVKNPDVTIKELLEDIKKKSGADIRITRMVRYKVGEGIDKKEDNFAEEVKKMVS